MILDNDLLDKAKRYCKIRGINIIGDKIPVRYMNEIKTILIQDQKRSRLDSSRSEAVNKFKCDKILKDMVRSLKVDSPIEEILRNALVIDGLSKHLRTQFQIGTKRVDFAFPIAKLVVEANGQEYHHDNQDQLDRDMKRDKYLARKGWRVLHIEGKAIRRNIQLCLDKIKEELAGKSFRWRE